MQAKNGFSNLRKSRIPKLGNTILANNYIYHLVVTGKGKSKNVHCTLGCPKKNSVSRGIWWVRLLWNDFAFTIFDFVHYSSERCSKPKLRLLRCVAQKTVGRMKCKNATENYKKKNRGFFGWIKIWKMMLIHKKCCVIKFPKIRDFLK